MTYMHNTLSILIDQVFLAKQANKNANRDTGHIHWP